MNWDGTRVRYRPNLFIYKIHELGRNIREEIRTPKLRYYTNLDRPGARRVDVVAEEDHVRGGPRRRPAGVARRRGKRCPTD